jgi:cobalt-zinc-cadmium efflux system protein
MAHSHELVGKKLVFSIFLNLFITVIQVIGGLFSGSLALLSDALHNFIDTFSLVTSFIAHKLSAREHTLRKTFGYKRAEILVALFNAGFLILATFFLLKEAGERLFVPVVVDSRIVFLAAGLGLLANSFSVLLLKSHTGENMNVRAAFFHLFADALVSLAVVLGAVCMYFLGIYRVDALLSLTIGVYIIREGYKIVKDAVNILMQYVPEDIEITEIKADIEDLSGVKNIHHVHVWAMTENDIHLEAHIGTQKNFKLSETCMLQKKIEKLLAEKHSINHVTLQFEYDRCENARLIRTSSHE